MPTTHHQPAPRSPRLLLLSSFILLPSSFSSASPPSSDYKLIFADEFRGSSLDTVKWNYNYTWGQTHNHRAFVAPEQVIVSQDRLNLQAIAQRHPSAPSTTTSGGVTYSLDYTSGAINSNGKLNFQYGYIEARIRMSDIAGTWPAFWTLGNGSWPATGEIDIMEFPRGGSNSATQYWANYHYTNSSNAHASYGWQNSGPNFTTGWNEFAVEWTSSQMKFYLNGSNIRTINDPAAIADATSQYMILNQAVGGWPGNPPSNNPLPSNYEVDWVHVFQKLPSGASSTSTWNINGGGSWDTTGNWTGGAIPKYSEQSAVFPQVGAAPSAVVSWSGSRTLGSISFTAPSTIYALTGTALQMASGSGATITASAASNVSHAISARLELYNSTTVTNNMAGGSTINLTGQIIGTGNLSIDGPGTVILAGNNTYTGDTIIDPGTAGPAVLRAQSNNALGTGVVIIGPTGNSTTARLELYGDRILPNPVTFPGRNTNTVAIQSVRGDNALTGTLTLSSGGANYFLQSDSGTSLTLSAPISLTSVATGPRNVTVQGGGATRITGAITNGAATLSLTKTGPGTLTLSGNNSYTGTTTLLQGTLVANPNAWSPLLTQGGADLQSGTLTFDYTGATSPKSAIESAIATGKIRNSTSDPYHTFVALDDLISKVTLQQVWDGDLNLDGQLTLDDYTLLDRGFAMGLTGWANGDINYDGQVNIGDYLRIDRAYSVLVGGASSEFLSRRIAQFGGEYGVALQNSVPEPSGILGGISALVFLAYKRVR